MKVVETGSSPLEDNRVCTTYQPDAKECRRRKMPDNVLA